MWNNQGQGFEQGGGYSNFGVGGGGFQQSPGGFASPSGTQTEKKRARVQQIIACTVSQLLAAKQTEDVFRLGDIELNQVTLVGIVRQSEKSPTNILYKVDDMTARPLDVRQWVDVDDMGNEGTVIPPSTYVMVVGHLRSFQNKKSLVAFKIRPLENINEITTHILEVVQNHMAISKPAGQANTTANTNLTLQSNTGPAVGSMMGDSCNGLQPQQSQVLSVIRTAKGQSGMSLADVKSRLGGMNPASIQKAIEFLSNEGHIYSTIDEQHYRSTEID
uniref:replication protein A 32 kDa subunit isoform X2 n=1 Tax=Myxine glutinosa TaxID=7769 RepID=UPI00358F0707